MAKLVNNESGILSLLFIFGKFKSVRLNAFYKSLELAYELAVMISQEITTCLVFKLVILILL